MLDALKGTLKAREVEFLENVGFDSLTTMRCGGIAPVVAYPRTLNEFVSVLRCLLKCDVPFKVVGNMSNVLPPDGLYNGVIVKTTALNSIFFDGNVVSADCGVKISSLLWRAAHLNLGGGEGLFMIPATLGGMVYGNAGAYGVSIADIFLDAVAYDAMADRIVTLEGADLDFSYRHSALSMRRMHILSARLNLTYTPFESIRARIAEFAQRRRASQPTAYPSLGSVFRREGDIIPARIIDNLGLKGMRVGGAKVSEKHAGFIVNTGNATSSDVKSLVEKITNTVTDRLSIVLKREIEYL